jgi:peptidoglycan hydrolase-like protein with peptidoglycan-binding domain
MAFVIGGSDPMSKKLYNVEQAVGTNAPNAGGDVKLIQYMLKHIYGSLTVDGYIGPNTLTAIRRFQQDAKNGGANVLVDGRIDRAFGQVSSVSHTTYSILLMNFALAKKNPAAFEALPQFVPLSANPKTSPYNPVQKKIRKVEVTYGQPKKVTITYDDGTTEVAYVSGKVIIGGQVLA